VLQPRGISKDFAALINPQDRNKGFLDFTSILITWNIYGSYYRSYWRETTWREIMQGAIKELQSEVAGDMNDGNSHASIKLMIFINRHEAH
jgi:hypothetical protein